MRIVNSQVTALLGIALAALAPIAGAQEQPDTTTGQQVYQVEMILVQFNNPGYTAAPAAGPPPSGPQQASPGSIDSGPSSPAESASPASQTPRWQPAPAANQRLVSASKRACSPGICKVLAYRSWLQPALPERDAYFLDLAEFDIDPANVSGRIKVYEKQALFLRAELHLNGSKERVYGGVRKMPLGKAVYFDDPELAVIAMITRSDATESTQ